MNTRKAVIIPVDLNEVSPLPADWNSRTRKLSPGLIQAAQSGMLQPEGRLSTVKKVPLKNSPGEKQ